MKVVVGIDTTPAANEALRWAARYARAVGGDLHAVHAYLGVQREVVPLPTDPNVPGKQLPCLQPPEEIRALFASVEPESGWTLMFHRRSRPSAQDAARDADLLVVGTGEHVGLGRLLVGSVSHQCITHATCPVVAVPAPQLIEEAGLTDDQKLAEHR